MVLAALAKAGVRRSFASRTGLLVRRCGLNRGDLDPGGVGHAQREFVAVQAKLHGVAHGREFHKRDLRAGNYAHIQKVLAKRALAAHAEDFGGLTGFECIKCHKGETPLLMPVKC